jgi:hypothetical protein
MSSFGVARSTAAAFNRQPSSAADTSSARPGCARYPARYG